MKLSLKAIRLGRSGFSHYVAGDQGVGNVICRRCTATFAVFVPREIVLEPALSSELIALLNCIETFVTENHASHHVYGVIRVDGDGVRGE